LGHLFEKYLLRGTELGHLFEKYLLRDTELGHLFRNNILQRYQVGQPLIEVCPCGKNFRQSMGKKNKFIKILITKTKEMGLATATRHFDLSISQGGKSCL
jgi:hypothetical protein